jgi:hypothetical protein
MRKSISINDFEVNIYLIYHCISIDFKSSVALTSWQWAT